jgi:hypothetical protein
MAFVATIKLSYDVVQDAIISHYKLRREVGAIDERDLQGVLSDPFAYLDSEMLSRILPSTMTYFSMFVEHLGANRRVLVMVQVDELLRNRVKAAIEKEMQEDTSIHPESLLAKVQREVIDKHRWQDVNDAAHQYIEDQCYLAAQPTILISVNIG